MYRSTLIFAVLLAATVSLPAQLSQTLPRGWEGISADFLLHEVVNDVSNDRWQWHYDTTEFDATGPILITEISVRSSSDLFLLNAFNFPQIIITLHEASTDYMATSHDPIFANNVLRSMQVKNGSWIGGPTLGTTGPTPVWVPFQLERPFLYDPTTGNDLIIEIQKCGTIATWGVPMDAEIRNSTEGPIGGARYGHPSSCFTSQASVIDADVVAVVKIDYEEAWQTLPVGFEATEGNSSTNFPFNVGASHRWQWHYEATDFRYQGPIRIDKLSFRADSGMTVNPSTVGSLEVRLIEASTSLGGHSPIFEQNVLRSSVVRTGSLGIPATGALANGTSDWIDLEIIGGFQYDPSSGNDLIVELKTCAGGALGASLDGDFTGNGGRFGHRSNCNALVTDFNQPTFVPIVRVDFTVPEVCTTTVTQFPYFEDFNGFATGTTPSNGWVNEAGENSGAQGDWYFRSGSTGTDNTGPTASHGGSGRYAHTEDSASEHAAINLLSPCFDISGVEHPLLRFRAWSQHANGLNQATENLLHVDFVFDDGSIAVNQLEIPASGPGWRVHQIPLATNMPVFRVRFRGASDNNDFRHDLAIDSVYVGSGGSREDFGLESRINFTGDPDAPEKDANPSDFFHWRLTTPDGTFNGSLVYLFGHLYTDGPKPTSGTGSRIYWPISQTITFYNGAAAPLGFLGVLNPIGIQDVWSVPAGLGIYSIVMQGLTVSGAAQSGGYAITPPHYFDLQ